MNADEASGFPPDDTAPALADALRPADPKTLDGIERDCPCGEPVIDMGYFSLPAEVQAEAETERARVRDLSELPLPPWLEGLSARDRISAVVAGVARCYSQSHDGDCNTDAGPHCTVTMGAAFLAKLLLPEPAGDSPHPGDSSDRDETPGDILREIRAELDDAFQFTGKDGTRHGYVTREWVEALLARAVERGSLLGPRVDLITISREDLRALLDGRFADIAAPGCLSVRARLSAAAEEA